MKKRESMINMKNILNLKQKILNQWFLKLAVTPALQ